MDKRIQRAIAEVERFRQKTAAVSQRRDAEVAEIRSKYREGPSPGLMAMLGMLLGVVFFAAGMAAMKIIVG